MAINDLGITGGASKLFGLEITDGTSTTANVLATNQFTIIDNDQTSTITTVNIPGVSGFGVGTEVVQYNGFSDGNVGVAGINNQGVIVGQYVPYNIDGFIYNNGSVIDVSEPNASSPGATVSGLNGINDAGVAVGVYTAPAQYAGQNWIVHGYIYNNGTYTDLLDPNTNISFQGAETVARGINNSGTVVGFYTAGTSGAYEGFVYSNGTYSTIDSGTGSTIPVAINDSGEIVGRDASGWFEYVNGVFTQHSNTKFIPTGINNAGTIVGSEFDQNSNGEGVIISNGVSHVFNVPNAAGTVIVGINNNGEILGEYYAGGKGWQEFIATPSL